MKDNLKTILGFMLFLVLAAMLLLVAKKAFSDPSVVLTDQVCDPPCWAGITPGQSTSYDVFTILGDMNSVHAAGIMLNYDRDDSLTSIQWYFLRPVPDSLGSIYFDQDIASAIDILTVNSITLAEAFELLGEPEQLWTRIGYGENDREYLDVFLINPVIGYRLELVIDTVPGSDRVDVKPATPVFSVMYFDPLSFQELLDGRILIDVPGHSFSEEFQAWHGYGELLVNRE